MSAIFPHRAVAERYLHTGARRASRKVVIAAFLAGASCAVLIANLPAGTLTGGAASPSAPAPVAKRVADGCKERTWPYNRCADAPAREAEKAPVRIVTTDQNAPPAGVTEDRPSTTGAVTNQPNTRPQQAAVPPPPQTSAEPPVARMEPAPTPAPQSVQADVTPPNKPPSNTQALAPEPSSQPVAAFAPAEPPKQATSAPPAQTTVREPRPPETARKPAPKKVANKAGTKEARARAARRQEARDGVQPTLVRVVELPDGRRVYQRIRGDEPGLGGSEVRRVYLSPEPVAGLD